MANIPNINRKHRIRVICEGYEDEAYFKCLMRFNVKQVFERIVQLQKCCSLKGL